MSGEGCEEFQLLIQADVDGELEPADAARVAAHVGGCADCARLQESLLALSAGIRRDIAPYSAPDRLRSSAASALGRRSVDRLLPRRAWLTGGGAAIAALAASAAVFAILPPRDEMPEWIVAAHIRALQPDHLVDVASGEQHTVKPWFAGRVPFSPPVKDLSAEGFPLVGGRLDYLPGHAAATLVYKRRGHVIDLFVWPDDGGRGGDATGGREGYNYVRWRRAGMAFWAVSDLNAAELAQFASLWR